MPKTVAVIPGILEMVNNGQNAIQTASVMVGSSTTDELLVTATGIPGWTVEPGFVNYVDQVWLQPRQQETFTGDHGWHDQFAVQYITGGPGNVPPEAPTMEVMFKVLRLDILYDSSPPPQVGWGQNLQVDIMLISSQGAQLQ